MGACAIFVGACLQGSIGFGFALVAVPPMMMVMEPTVVVPTLIIMSILNTSWISVQTRSDVVPGIVAPLVIGAALGVPVGIIALTEFDGPLFKTIVGVAMILLATLMFSGWQHPLKNQKAGLYPVGFVSGVLNGSVSILGPPVVLFLANQQTPKNVFRASIVTYFTIINLISLGFFAREGLLTREVIVDSAVFAPVLLLATALGGALSKRISDEIFQRILLALVVLGGTVLIAMNGRTLV